MQTIVLASKNPSTAASITLKPQTHPSRSQQSKAHLPGQADYSFTAPHVCWRAHALKSSRPPSNWNSIYINVSG